LSEPPLFSLPDDAGRLSALVLAVAAPFVAPRVLASRALRWIAPIAAALLSLGYVHIYLRGGPRIIDASAYWLEARALAEGMFAFPIGEPEHAVLGRFLLRTTVDGQPAASVIFPPGYPAVLALGFAVGAPLWVGPLLGAGLVIITMDLAARVARLGAPAWQQRERELAGFAGIASVLCATLRYHTADTMAHGLAALCAAGGLSACLAVGTTEGRAQLLASGAVGLGAGWQFATRPASALALVATLLALLAWFAPSRAILRSRPLFCVALGAAPGIALWLLYQSAATGSWLGTAQEAYYLTSDGPPGCFRYGFGEGIGCLGEHGDFVRANLANGYGVLAALATTGRRIKMHLGDALNFAPLFALVAIGAVFARRRPASRALIIALVAQVCAYAPFYFDGNYPAGGARMFADVLPHEHVLAGLGLLALGRSSVRPHFVRLAGAVLAIALAAFAFQSGGEHRALADRDGGRPLFEPDLWTDERALLFLDSDHGFNLAYRPGQRNVARFHGDALDELAWDAAGRPAAFRYRFDAKGARLEPLRFEPLGSLRVEGESLWPPVAQRRGWAWPVHSPRGCVSGGRLLGIYPSGGEAEVQLRLPKAALGRALEVVAALGIDSPDSRNCSMIIELYDGPTALVRMPVEGVSGCLRVPPVALPEVLNEPLLVVRAGDPVGIDVLYLGKKR
jgi:hypothetical protein